MRVSAIGHVTRLHPRTSFQHSFAQKWFALKLNLMHWLLVQREEREENQNTVPFEHLLAPQVFAPVKHGRPLRVVKLNSLLVRAVDCGVEGYSLLFCRFPLRLES